MYGRERANTRERVYRARYLYNISTLMILLMITMYVVCDATRARLCVNRCTSKIFSGSNRSTRARWPRVNCSMYNTISLLTNNDVCHVRVCSQRVDHKLPYKLRVGARRSHRSRVSHVPLFYFILFYLSSSRSYFSIDLSLCRISIHTRDASSLQFHPRSRFVRLVS